jgi:hypothetical protein
MREGGSRLGHGSGLRSYGGSSLYLRPEGAAIRVQSGGQRERQVRLCRGARGAIRVQLGCN